MGRIIGLILVLGMLWGAIQFVRQWNATTPPGVGSGRIAGKSQNLPARDKRPVSAKVKSQLVQITENPARFESKRATVRGRVRGAMKYASNRNMYLLVEGDNRLLVIDDKKPPREYWPRTVSGTVKVIGPPVGGLQYAYLVDVKKGVRIDPPKWTDIAHFFTDKYNKVKTSLQEELRHKQGRIVFGGT